MRIVILEAILDFLVFLWSLYFKFFDKFSTFKNIYKAGNNLKQENEFYRQDWWGFTRRMDG